MRSCARSFDRCCSWNNFQKVLLQGRSAIVPPFIPAATQRRAGSSPEDLRAWLVVINITARYQRRRRSVRELIIGDLPVHGGPPQVNHFGGANSRRHPRRRAEEPRHCQARKPWLSHGTASLRRRASSSTAWCRAIGLPAVRPFTLSVDCSAHRCGTSQ
jgi:hypothetical protein